MKDYTQGKIYKYVNIYDESLCYVGSTTKTLEQRDYKHKHKSKYEPIPFHRKVDGKWNEWRIVLIENYPCSCECSCEKIECRRRLAKKEGIYIREIATLNYEVAGRTSKEHYEENKIKISEKNKEWRRKNQEQIKKHYQENKEVILEKNKYWREQNKLEIAEKKKEKYQQNKEVILEKRKEYREKNRDEINRKKREAYALKKAQQNGV